MTTHIIEAPDGQNLYADVYAQATSQAVMIIVHGHGEHSGRYRHMAEWFNNQNTEVWAINLRGHGQTSGPRGTARYSTLLDDIFLWVERVSIMKNEQPIFLYGHSMGGQLVLSYHFRRPLNHLSGIIASAPWIQLAINPNKWLIQSVQWAARLFPDMPFHTSLNPALISRDDNVVRAYIKDPLVHDVLSAELATALLQRGEKLLEYIETVEVPVLFMHGSEDRITSPTASATMAAALLGDVTYKVWQGMYHEIHNEPLKEDVFQFTLRWILKHLPTHGSKRNI